MRVGEQIADGAGAARAASRGITANPWDPYLRREPFRDEGTPSS